MENNAHNHINEPKSSPKSIENVKQTQNRGTQDPGKKPKLSKADRRAIQEAQRAAKAATSGSKKNLSPSKKHRKHIFVDKNRVNMFSHLPQFNKDKQHPSAELKFGSNERTPPIIMKLGLKFQSGVITGANSRCCAMLRAFQIVIRDFTPPGLRGFGYEIDHMIKSVFDYLTKCRPHSILMGNAMKYVRGLVFRLNTVEYAKHSVDEAKDMLIEYIDSFVYELEVAVSQVSEKMNEKIYDKDVIMVYGREHAVEKALLAAHRDGKKIQVKIIDSRPCLQGKLLLRVLAKAGLNCEYYHINAVSYAMKNVDKIVLGAAAMFSNGAALANVGTAVVAAVAKCYNKPVIVCCETKKFSERVSLDSICTNELRDADELIEVPDEATSDVSHRLKTLKDWKSNDHLKLLNIMYDLTPAANISFLMTEFGCNTPFAVPVIVREKQDLVPVL